MSSVHMVNPSLPLAFYLSVKNSHVITQNSTQAIYPSHLFLFVSSVLSQPTCHTIYICSLGRLLQVRIVWTLSLESRKSNFPMAAAIPEPLRPLHPPPLGVVFTAREDRKFGCKPRLGTAGHSLAWGHPMVSLTWAVIKAAVWTPYETPQVNNVFDDQSTALFMLSLGEREHGGCEGDFVNVAIVCKCVVCGVFVYIF